MGEVGKDDSITKNGKFSYYDLTGRRIFLDQIPKEPDYWKEYDLFGKQAVQIAEKLPCSEFAWHIVKEKCKKEYFDSPDEQLKYLLKVLDMHKSVIKKLNAKIKKQDVIFDKINRERKNINNPPYAKMISETLKLRDNIFENYEEINRILERIEGSKKIEKSRTESTISLMQDELNISERQFSYIIDKLKEIDVVSSLTVENTSSIFHSHFADNKEPCLKSERIRIDFTTTWFNVRYIYEELLKGWFKKKMAWKSFVDKHMLLNGERTKSKYKNTKAYKDSADETVKTIVKYIRDYIIKNPI